jgi:hemerythrin-like domain-containing protein
MNEGLQIHPMHLHGLVQRVIAKDGYRLPEPYDVDTLMVAPGERYDVLVKADAPGVWAFHCHILNHVEGPEGMFGMVTAVYRRIGGRLKRHENLIPLTHDHHDALAQARRLELAAQASLPARLAASNSFVDFFESDTRAHFREEEELVFPLVIDAAEAETPLIHLLLEHVRVYALVGKLRSEIVAGDSTGETMSSIASLLQSHIRFEEKVLFPLVESLAPEKLRAVNLAERTRGSVELPRG